MLQKKNNASATKLLSGCCAAVMALGALAAPATAQEAPRASSASGIQDIVVTARKVEENLQDVPVAVSAFSGKVLEAQGATDFKDLASFTPGFTTVQSVANSTALNLSLRGQVQGDVIATLEPAVGTYVDGLYWARAQGLNSDLLDVESAQILKGPQGTLFGMSTTGGAVLVQTQNPDPSGFSGLVRGTLGRFSERTGTIVLNAPLVTDTVAVRGAFQISKRNGYVRDILNAKRYQNRDNLQGRVKLLARPADGMELVLSGEWFSSDQFGPGFTLRYPIPGAGANLLAGFGIPGGPFTTVAAYVAAKGGLEGARLTALDTTPFINVDTQTYTGNFSWDLGDSTLKLIAGYRKVKNDNLADFDGSPWAVHRTPLSQDLKQWSTELQFSGKTFDDRLTYVLGATYFKESGTDASATVALPAFTTEDNLFFGRIDNKSFGVYSQGTFNITEDVRFTAGLRYSDDSKGITSSSQRIVRATGNVSFCLINTAVAPNCLAPFSESKFNNLSWTLGLDYKPVEDILIYAKASRGYRAGGKQLRAVSVATQAPFEPEIVDEYEMGLKSTFFSNKVRLNLAGYLNNVKNGQRTTIYTDSRAITYTLLENAAKAQNYGLEGELTVAVADSFQISATGSIMKAKYKSFFDPNTGADRSGERFQYVPEKMFTLSAVYSRPIGATNFSLRADYSWSGPIASDPFNDKTKPAIIAATTVPATGILSARASFAFDEGFELAFWGKNLTDERSYISTLLVAGLGYASSIPREPLTFGVTGTFRFGGN